MADAMVRRCRPLLGTFVEIAVPAGFEHCIDKAFDAVAHVHARMSFHEESSDLAALRRAPVGEAVTVDAQCVAVLRIAADLHAQSGGLFDVAIGSDLVSSGFLPCPGEQSDSAWSGTTADIVILDDTHIACARPMLIDLGGIAKGYAVDVAVEALAAAGVPQAIVNAGGDLRVLGETPQQVHLREANGALSGVIELANAALASSSNRHMRRHDDRGIASPHLGRNRIPILSDLAVTVIAGQCIIADAMTKIALADPELAEAMLETLGGEIIARPMENLI